jgi:acyl carrier protein
MAEQVNVLSKEELQAMILEVKPQSAEHAISEDEDLWEARFLDSFAVVRLVFLIEEKLGIAFDFKDINARNFRSIKTILKLLGDKHGTPAK